MGWAGGRRLGTFPSALGLREQAGEEGAWRAEGGAGVGGLPILGVWGRPPRASGVSALT